MRIKTLEAQRRKGAELLSEGLSCREVARKLSVSIRAVQRWKAAVAAAGPDALAPRPRAGRPSKISLGHRERLIAWIQAQRSDGRILRLQEIEGWLYASFGIRYHHDFLRRMIKRIMP